MRVLEASFERRLTHAVAAAILPSEAGGGAVSTAAPRGVLVAGAPVDEDPTNKS